MTQLDNTTDIGDTEATFPDVEETFAYQVQDNVGARVDSFEEVENIGSNEHRAERARDSSRKPFSPSPPDRSSPFLFSPSFYNARSDAALCSRALRPRALRRCPPPALSPRALLRPRASGLAQDLASAPAPLAPASAPATALCPPPLARCSTRPLHLLRSSERSSEEGRHDVTSEQALYIQLGLGTEVEEAFIQREDDVSGPSHGNTRNGDPRNHCEDGMGAAIPCSDVLFDETRTIFDIVKCPVEGMLMQRVVAYWKTLSPCPMLDNSSGI
ncbi:hypothetical protein GUJ93_ZPchr0012g20400 [Zizania palustris]|uniref:Uncharacterized protein n=1 Tax=Zizania palustris TaxID=103762 RepID=A0A8J6BWB7_ZIZPA|nr:hypothetical protein GUJ93_ZPchr0012g20400 [Zizania palustris]